MQRAEAQLDLRFLAAVKRNDRHAVGVLVQPAGLDGGLNLLEGIDRHVRVELAADDDELAARRHVRAVRAFRLGREVQNALVDGRLQADELDAVERLDLARLDDFLGLLPVEDVQVVGVVLGRAGLERWVALLYAAGGQFGIERVAEEPALAHALAGVAQVLPIGRQLDLERLRHVHAALDPVELPEGDQAAILRIVLLEPGVLPADRRGVLRAFDHVFGVGRDERAAVVVDGIRVLDQLLGLEVAQIDHRQAGVGLVVDEHELAVVLALRLRDVGVVRVAPLQLAAVGHVAALQDFVGRTAETVALPRLGGEHGQHFQDAHRRHADDQHLPGLAAGREHDVRVGLAGRHVGLDGGVHVIRRQAALGDHRRRVGRHLAGDGHATRAGHVAAGRRRRGLSAG